MSALKEKFQAKIGPMRERYQKILKEHGEMKIGDSTIAQTYGGMRSIKCMLWETSALDPNEGIRFRGFTIPELQAKLPKLPGTGEPLPEGLFYLLLLGEIPTLDDAMAVGEDWKKRAQLPEYLLKVLDSLPQDLHPMTQFSLAILALQKDSKFASQYRDGHAQAQLLGAHVRRRHGHHRQAPGDRGPHLHALLQGRQVHRPRRRSWTGRPTWPTRSATTSPSSMT